MTYNDLYENEISVFCKDNDFMFLRNKKILLSGATGLIGSYFVDSLLCNKDFDVQIYALVRNKSTAQTRFLKHINDKRLTFVETDLSKEIDFNKNVDYVLHLASNTDPKNYALFPVETMITNFYGCKNLLDVAVRCKAKKFFLASSCEIYGTSEEEMFEENCGKVNPMDVRSSYNESKRASETLCVAYNKEFNISTVIGRFCRIFGPTAKPTDTKALSQFIKKAINEEDIVLKSEGNQKYSYLYVSDAVAGMLCLLEKGQDAEAYNISEDKNIMSLKEIANYIAKQKNVNVVFSLPSKSEMNAYSRAINSILKIDKIKKLSWQPKVTFKDGLNKTIEYFNSQEK